MLFSFVLPKSLFCAACIIHKIILIAGNRPPDKLPDNNNFHGGVGVGGAGAGGGPAEEEVPEYPADIPLNPLGNPAGNGNNPAAAVDQQPLGGQGGAAVAAAAANSGHVAPHANGSENNGSAANGATSASGKNGASGGKNGVKSAVVAKTFRAYLPPACHRTYSCVHCRAHLANHDELISKSFQVSMIKQVQSRMI